jgi:hypothetical protein
VARLHLLLKHGGVGEDSLEVVDILGPGDDLATFARGEGQVRG